MSTRHGIRAVWLGLLVTIASALHVLPAGAAGTTLRFFNLQQSVTATDATGAPLPNGGSGTTPQPGYHLDYTALDYPGSHAHHSSRYTASSHLSCTFTSSTSLTCNLQLAVGASLILGNSVTATLAGNGVSSIPVNAGTGRYKNARGTVTVTPVPNSPNADILVTLNS